jgi:VWFA-related protein
VAALGAWGGAGRQIRTGVILVPLDVRVIDRDGNPVTDLTASDFTILEDGVPQQISYFVKQSPDAPAAIEPGSPLSDAVVTHRTFLFVLGRGQLNAPVKAIDALIDFIRTKTLPSDRIGVLAFQRATPLTTNHDLVVRLLEHFRDRHSSIDQHIANLSLRASGAIWLSPKTRETIDDFFDLPGLPAVQYLPGGEGTLRFPFDNSTYLLNGIEYLRLLPGEKHLVLISERPLPLGGVHGRPDDHPFMRLATGARVALSFINTGGVPGQPMWRGRLILSAGSQPLLEAGDHRILTQQTGGGMTAFYRDAAQALARFDRGTRFQYLLAYYPTDTTSDSRNRTIQVLVMRPGVTIQYRHGYQVRPLPGSPDEIRKSITEGRIADILSSLQRSERTVRRLPKLAANVITSSTGEMQVKVHASFDASRVMFEKRGDAFVGDIDMAVAVDGANGEPLVQKIERLAFEFSAGDYARLHGSRREFLEASITLEVEGEPEYLRVVLFEYESNWFSAQTAPLRK